MAGLRTNALVSTGAALFVLMSDSMPQAGDGMRVAAQIVSGVGFLGAGVIMREGLSVRGLNTAATVWCSAAVGALAGYGFLLKAALGVFFIVAANLFLRPIAQKINQQPSPASEEERQYEVRVVCRDEEETKIRSLILQVVGSTNLVLRSLHSEDFDGPHKVEVKADLESNQKERCTPRANGEPAQS